jgi:hypothetical protein
VHAKHLIWIMFGFTGNRNGNFGEVALNQALREALDEGDGAAIVLPGQVRDEFIRSLGTLLSQSKKAGAVRAALTSPICSTWMSIAGHTDCRLQRHTKPSITRSYPDPTLNDLIRRKCYL